MPQQTLDDMLKSYRPLNDDDEVARDMANHFCQAAYNTGDHNLRRTHVNLWACANGWVVHPAGYVLLHQHARTGKWWPFGGRFMADDRANPVRCALREIGEESGLDKQTLGRLQPWQPALQDIHIPENPVPKRKGLPLIFSIGFWWQPDAKDDGLKDGTWFPLDDPALQADALLERLQFRTKAILGQKGHGLTRR